MKVKIKDSIFTKCTCGNKTIDFTGYIGELYPDGIVEFDERSRRRLPKWWIKQAEIEGSDPYSYVFREEDLEIMG